APGQTPRTRGRLGPSSSCASWVAPRRSRTVVVALISRRLAMGRSRHAWNRSLTNLAASTAAFDMPIASEPVAPRFGAPAHLAFIAENGDMRRAAPRVPSAGGQSTCHRPLIRSPDCTFSADCRVGARSGVRRTRQAPGGGEALSPFQLGPTHLLSLDYR